MAKAVRSNRTNLGSGSACPSPTLQRDSANILPVSPRSATQRQSSEAMLRRATMHPTLRQHYANKSGRGGGVQCWGNAAGRCSCGGDVERLDFHRKGTEECPIRLVESMA